jgi:hypothetical protein
MQLVVQSQSFPISVVICIISAVALYVLLWCAGVSRRQRITMAIFILIGTVSFAAALCQARLITKHNWTGAKSTTVLVYSLREKEQCTDLNSRRAWEFRRSDSVSVSEFTFTGCKPDANGATPLFTAIQHALLSVGYWQGAHSRHLMILTSGVEYLSASEQSVLTAQLEDFEVEIGFVVVPEAVHTADDMLQLYRLVENLDGNLAIVNDSATAEAIALAPISKVTVSHKLNLATVLHSIAVY